MQSLQCVGPIFRHYNWLAIFLMPSSCFINDTLGNHIDTTSIAVPGIVAIETDYIQIFSLLN